MGSTTRVISNIVIFDLSLSLPPPRRFLFANFVRELEKEIEISPGVRDFSIFFALSRFFFREKKSINQLSNLTFRE